MFIREKKTQYATVLQLVAGLMEKCAGKFDDTPKDSDK
jgi:hypothetical protein